MKKQYHIDLSFFNEEIYFRDTRLIQIGRLFIKEKTAVEKHAHLDFFELTIVTDGSCTVLTNGNETKMKKGDIYLSFPGDFHEIRTGNDSILKYDYFSFNTQNKLLKNEFLRIISEFYSCEQRKFRDKIISDTVSAALLEILEKDKYCDEIIALMFEQILFRIARIFNTEKMSEKENRKTVINELCFRIMYYIDTNIYSIKNLTELTEEFSYNYSYLSYIFSQNTGNTILNYYSTRRLDAARLLLDEGKLRIKSIAEMLNYSSVYAFSKAFKNRFGISPRGYATGKK